MNKSLESSDKKTFNTPPPPKKVERNSPILSPSKTDANKKVLHLPYKFIPRPYQLNSFNAISSRQYKRGVSVWHRRAGKEKTFLNLTINETQKRVGLYYYFFPTYAQGKKILWDGIDKSGMPFLDHFPKAIVKKKNETELQITLHNGSIFQIIGTDRMDSIVGTNPVGCVFSEFSLQDPRGWEFIRPILAENDGWAVFDYTPRGKNHGWHLYRMAKVNDDWFCEKLTVDDTKAINPEEIEAERKAGMPEELIQQEFYCSFEGFMEGSYYTKQMQAAEADGRITRVPWEATLKVDTYWDLGIGDAMVIWFVQSVGREIRIIDYLEGMGEGLPYYIKKLGEKPYVYGTYHVPHDARVRELGTGKSRIDTMVSLGCIDVRIVRNIPVEDGVDAVRNILSRCWFDAEKCARGIECLSSYRKVWDEKRKEFKAKPHHDWASHGADGFRYFAVGYNEFLNEVSPPPVESNYSIFN